MQGAEETGIHCAEDYLGEVVADLALPQPALVHRAALGVPEAVAAKEQREERPGMLRLHPQAKQRQDSCGRAVDHGEEVDLKEALKSVADVLTVKPPSAPVCEHAQPTPCRALSGPVHIAQDLAGGRFVAPRAPRLARPGQWTTPSRHQQRRRDGTSRATAAGRQCGRLRHPRRGGNPARRCALRRPARPAARPSLVGRAAGE